MDGFLGITNMRHGMRHHALPLRGLLIFVVCNGLALDVRPGAGQTPSTGSTEPPSTLSRAHFGVGYVGNAPSAMLGGSGYLIIPTSKGPFGLYLDAKFDVGNPSNETGFEPGLTASQVEDEVVGNEFVRSEGSWRSFNAALLRPLSPYFYVYAGAGIAQRTVYHLYEEPSLTLGVAGVFWVEAPARSEHSLNLLTGAILRLSSRISTQFGFETQPRGVTVGISARIPRW